MFDTLQLIGGLILAVGYIPQIIQIIRTKSCNDLNLKTYATVLFGIALMEVYAINLVANGTGLMFLVTNTMALAVNEVLCGLIIKYKKGAKTK
jgi:MtN3 and saliva related transmembrane protein